MRGGVRGGSRCQAGVDATWLECPRRCRHRKLPVDHAAVLADRQEVRVVFVLLLLIRLRAHVLHVQHLRGVATEQGPDRVVPIERADVARYDRGRCDERSKRCGAGSALRPPLST